MAFVQAYRMIQQWREADDDEEDSAARKAEIEHLLESKNAVESFQQLLHLVIKDSMHYENDVDTDDEDEESGNITADEDSVNVSLDDGPEADAVADAGEASGSTPPPP